MRIICVYDNHKKPNVFIKNVVGDKTFGDVILKRKSVKEKFMEFLYSSESTDDIIEFDHDWQAPELINRLRLQGPDVRIIHVFSDLIIQNVNEVRNILKKAQYINENYLWTTKDDLPALFMMCGADNYCSFVEKSSEVLRDPASYQKSVEHFEKIKTDAFFNISDYSNFLQYISGGFDARFFNSVSGDEFIVTKSSVDKKKIKAEFEYYWMLPDSMKLWFVMPYNYRETQETASYDMERYHVTDLAIRWVHGAISRDEFKSLMHKVFHFLQARKTKDISKNEYDEIAKSLYQKKVDERIEQLKKHESFSVLQNLLYSGTRYKSLDAVVAAYKKLYGSVRSGIYEKPSSVIGHGDLCFSNMLYNKETDLLKLIDSKGALDEAQMWTNPYYDIAKLSHSICGRYDFFNNGLHLLTLNSDLNFQLEIDFDNSEFKHIFKQYVESAGYSYSLVRVYECSLFLSMLPLHMDNPQKVFGFILNAIEIIEELEKCLKK